MEINADFNRRASMHAAELPWIASPMPGVERRMLDRIGGEVARATTIVRYAPNSHFSAHVHDGGEEFVVLSGTFEDEHGAYPAGSYIRNPPTSSHTPGSTEGCVILVKLWQFDPADRKTVRLNMADMPLAEDPVRPGVRAAILHQDRHELVLREIWEPGRTVTLNAAGGAEIFVLQGGFEESGKRFERHDWLRLPDGDTLSATAGPEGAELWVKCGHLSHVRAPSAA